MSALAKITFAPLPARAMADDALAALVEAAANRLASAKSSAEVLDARDMASVAYDAAKKAGRMHQAKGAHDTLVAAAHRAQADALEIESLAKRCLADEYDAAQGRVDLSDRVGTGVFAAWADPAFFERVFVDRESGTVAWPGGLDLCPDRLYSDVTGSHRPGSGTRSEGTTA